MIFTEPLEVSKSNNNKDKLRISIDESFFKTKSNNLVRLPAQKLELEIPKQFPSEDEKVKTEAVAKGVKNLMTYNILFNFMV